MKQKRMRWDAVIDRMPKDRPSVGVELGVYRGKMSRQLLRGLPRLTLYLVDRWTTYTEEERRVTTGRLPQEEQEHFDEAYRMTLEVVSEFPERAIIVRNSTTEALSRVAGKVDFVFIDADHSYEACRQDIELWKGRIVPGGYLFGHDYGRARHPGVKRAVDRAFPDGVETDVNGVWGIQL